MNKPSQTAEALSAELEAKLLRRLVAEWENLNEAFFRGALRRPTFSLSHTRTRLGAWHSEFRSLEISRALVLEHSWGEVVEVLKHEIAHQFVEEVLAADEPTHGPSFRGVCEKLGISGGARMSLETAAAASSDDARSDRLVKRIRKLLALANSSNQHEAENAASAAQKLMLRFNIELASLEAPSRRDYGYRHLGRVSGKTFEYQRRVAMILGEHFFVEAIWVPGYRPIEGKAGSVLEICGREANLEMAEFVHDFLHGTAERLWAEYKLEQGIRGNKDRRTFLAGVMGGFEAKLDAQRVSFQEEGLVWVPQAELHRFFRARHPHIRNVRNAGSQRNEAFGAGHQAGGGIVLSQPVKAGSSGRAPKALKPGRS